MIRLLATITLAVNLVASSASAFDPVHFKRLKETNECVGCELSKANLFKADLTNAKLSYANLSEANLVGANLRGAVLRFADLSGANLSGADITRTLMNGATFCNTTMPDGSVLYTGC